MVSILKPIVQIFRLILLNIFNYEYFSVSEFTRTALFDRLQSLALINVRFQGKDL